MRSIPSLNDLHGGKSNDELNHGPVVRLRNVSGVGRGGDHSSCYVLCDEVYQCLLPEMQNEWAVDYGTDEEEGSRSPVSYSEMCRQLSMSMDNRAEFHRHLQIIINTNSTARLKRSSEKTSSARLDSSSKRMFLVSRTNERFKWSDLLWLQLQATVAGRQMKPVSVQIRSTREHDIYLLAEREKQKIILDEIRNFHVDADTGCASASSSCHSSEQDLLKANLKVVRCLLDRYEDFVALYPNTYCMDRANKLSEVVKVCVQILYAWYNIIMDLYTRIREVLFFVDFRFT
ncbi:unnamed protein product [Gongylonema pulchrum]|uniref:DH domain-containing protein n=1 Tax=Gongylonema pulchrum TaxID=637853 RepID=A0A183EGM1_9BILA|nr:unnamed protein product [Gongylonema pulchrum]